MENYFIKKPVTQEELEKSLKRYESDYDNVKCLNINVWGEDLTRTRISIPVLKGKAF